MKLFKEMKDMLTLANASRKGMRIITEEDGSYTIVINDKIKKGIR